MPTRSKSMPYTTEPDGYLEPRIGKTGTSALAPITVIEQFNKIVAAYPSRPAMGLKRPVNGKVGAVTALKVHCSTCLWVPNH